MPATLRESILCTYPADVPVPLGEPPGPVEVGLLPLPLSPPSVDPLGEVPVGLLMSMSATNK